MAEKRSRTEQLAAARALEAQEGLRTDCAGVLDLDAYATERQWSGKPVRLGGREWILRGALSLDESIQFEQQLGVGDYRGALGALVADPADRDEFLAVLVLPILDSQARALWQTIFDYLSGSTSGEGGASERS